MLKSDSVCQCGSTDNRSESQPSIAEFGQPGRIVSFWDMIRAVKMELVARTYANILEINQEIESGKHTGDGELHLLVSQRFAGDPNNAYLQRCFPGFSMALADLKEAFDSDHPYETLRTRLRDMEAVLRYDLKQPRYFVLPSAASAFLDEESVPKVIREVMENVIFDLEQANRSLAFGLNSACVYHCMCALDYFLTFIRKRLAILAGDGVEVAHTDLSWKTAIDIIESRIRELDKKPKTPETKAELSELSPLCAHMMAVKGAWRNDTMHAKGRFDEGTANDILDETKIVLKYAAERYAVAKPEVTA